MDPAGLEALQDAIRNMHGCESIFVESQPVTERFQGAIVWDGAWDDRCDPRDEDLRVAHLSCLIELALETSAAAHEASDEVASELFRLRTSSRREISRRG